MKELMIKLLKNAAYEASKGGLVVGGAAISLIDAEPYTIAYLVFAGFIFNLLKELLKKIAE